MRSPGASHGPRRPGRGPARPAPVETPAVEDPVPTLLWLVGLLVALGAAAQWGAADLDVFWHIRAGEWVAAHGLLHRELWLWPVRGQAVVHHEWLAQRLLAALWHLGGGALVTGWGLGMFAAVPWVLARLHRRHGVPAFPALGSGLLLMAALYPHSVPRPHLWTVLGTAALLYALHTPAWWSSRPQGRSVLLAGLGAALWMNLHSGALFGVGLLVAATGAETLAALGTRRIGGASGAARPWPLGPATITLAALLGTLATPFGASGWWHAVRVSGDPVFGALLTEFAPPSASWHRLWIPWVGLCALLALPRRRALQPWQVGVVLAALPLGCAALRHLPLLVLVALGALGPSTWGRDPWRPAPAPTWRSSSWTALRVLVPAVSACVLLLAQLSNVPGPWVLSPRGPGVPTGAVRALLRLAPAARQRPLTSLAAGTLVRWYAPEAPAFVDIRGDAYGGALLSTTHDLLSARPGAWQPLIERLRPDVVVLERSLPLAQALWRTPGWQAVFCDTVGVVFAPGHAAQLPARQGACAALPVDTTLHRLAAGPAERGSL